MENLTSIPEDNPDFQVGRFLEKNDELKGQNKNFKTFLFDSDQDDEKHFFVILYGKN